MSQVSPSVLRSPLTRWSVAPASVTVSTPSPSFTGNGSFCAPEKDSTSVLMATSGRRRVSSGSASMRSRSSCGEDSTPLTCGWLPNVSLASPRSLIARSSGPYWNSICSSTAAAPSPLTRLVTRHDSMRPPSEARPTARAKVRLPS